MYAPVESELTVYVICVNAPGQVVNLLRLSGSFLCLRKASGGQALPLNRALLHRKGCLCWPPYSALHRFRPLVCACQRRIISAESPCCEDNLQDKSMFPESSSTWFM